MDTATPCYLLAGLAEDLATGDPISTWQNYSVCVLCGAQDPAGADDHRDYCVWVAARMWHRTLFGDAPSC